nr:BRO family protein [Mimivirus sp.]
MDNIFKYIFDNINIYVIKDDNGIKWYKLLDVLKILNLKQKYKTVCDIVSNDYICKYNTIKRNNNAINIIMDKSNDSVITNESNDSVITNESNDRLITNQLSNKTLFINNCGLIQLLSKSNEYNAKNIWFELCNNIIPIIHQRGIYIQNDNQSIDQYLNEHNYSDSLISEYKKLLLYM